MPTERVTMRGLARKLGCSPMTISKALRGSSDISEATREKVLKTSRRLGYLPNNWASAAKSSRFNNVSYIFEHPLPDPIIPLVTTLHMEFVSGVSEVLLAENMFLSVAFSRRRIMVDTLPQPLRERISDGILAEFEMDPETRSHLERLGIPIVYLNSNIQDANDCVFADEFHIGYEATTHCVRSGHRRVLFAYSLAPGESLASVHFSLKNRLAGYERAMADAGLHGTPLRVEAASGDVFAEKVITFLKGEAGRDFTAVVSGGAMPVYVEALRQGVRIPEDLAIVALDMPFCDTRVFFKLDRVMMDRRAMGMAAARMLLEKVRHPGACPSCIDKPSILPLGSCATPRTVPTDSRKGAHAKGGTYYV